MAAGFWLLATCFGAALGLSGVAKLAVKISIQYTNQQPAHGFHFIRFTCCDK
jgi:hypothetical protein